MKFSKILPTLTCIFLISTHCLASEEPVKNIEPTEDIQEISIPLKTFEHKKGVMNDSVYTKNILNYEIGMQNVEKMEKDINSLKNVLKQEVLKNTDKTTIEKMEKDIMEKRSAQTKAIETIIKEIGVPIALKSVMVGWYGARKQPWNVFKTKKDLNEFSKMDENKVNPFPDLITAFKKFIRTEKPKLAKEENSELLTHLRQLKLNPEITNEQKTELKTELNKALTEKDFEKQKEALKKFFENDNFFAKQMRSDIVKDIEELNFSASLNGLRQSINKLLRK